MALDELPKMDLANWMRDLPMSLRLRPLVTLAIPGSHNAMMYSVLKNSPAAPDAPHRSLGVVHKIFPGCVKNWIMTQKLTITEQLSHGVRYLDIRTSYHEGRFMFCHGLFACETLQPLEDVNTFLNGHPGEVVILDFQHVYNCDRELHQKYCDTILSIFGKKVLPRCHNDLSLCSIQSMTAAGKQVLVVYRKYSDEKRQFWCSNHFPTPWPNTMSRQRLRAILDVNIELRDMDNGFISQFVLTPTINYILLHPFGSVRESCAKRVLRKLIDWIGERPVGMGEALPVPTYNVFIADYVDLDDDLFTRTVINLNFRKDPSEIENEEMPELTDLE